MPNQSPPKRDWEARLSEAASRVETELKQVVRTIDEEVVPEVRCYSSSALRSLAARLDQLARHMDDTRDSQQRSAAIPYTPSPPPPTASRPDSPYPRSAYDDPASEKDGPQG